MFNAASIMSGESIVPKTRCIVDYEIKKDKHTFTFMSYADGTLSQIVLSNWLFDNGYKMEDVSDVLLMQRGNTCWSLKFAIHSRDNYTSILEYKSITFIDNRLWVSDTKMIKNTRWKHPYTETIDGAFNARSGHCSSTKDTQCHLIVTGSNIEPSGEYKIERINKNGFMQVETDNGMIIQHLNNFDEVEPEEVKGVWYNDNLNLWMFENTDEINSIRESYVYLLLDTHARQPRYCAKDATGPLYTYDYTKALAFFSEVEAYQNVKQINIKTRSSFTVDQWI